MFHNKIYNKIRSKHKGLKDRVSIPAGKILYHYKMSYKQIELKCQIKSSKQHKYYPKSTCLPFSSLRPLTPKTPMKQTKN